MLRTASKRSALKSSLDEAEEYEDPLLDDDDGAPNAKRRPWNPDEDEQLRSLVDQFGIKSWAQIATNLTNRNGKQCRERWRNHLRPQLNKGEWSVQEDIDIWDKVQEMGTKWAQISELYMSQRTDNDIKNRWNSIIRKQQHPAGRDWLPEENGQSAAIRDVGIKARHKLHGHKQGRNKHLARLLERKDCKQHNQNKIVNHSHLADLVIINARALAIDKLNR